MTQKATLISGRLMGKALVITMRIRVAPIAIDEAGRCRDDAARQFRREWGGRIAPCRDFSPRMRVLRLIFVTLREQGLVEAMPIDLKAVIGVAADARMRVTMPVGAGLGRACAEQHRGQQKLL